MSGHEAPASCAARLYELWAEIVDLGAAEQLLDWDQQTMMPKAGLAGRGQLRSTLAALRHERLTAPELGEVLDACAELAVPLGDSGLGGDFHLADQVREARRQVDRAARVPTALARALAQAQSTCLAAWTEARERSDFSVFEPHLARMLDLKKQEAQAIAPERLLYDTLLDEYEPGATEATLSPLFEELEGALVELLGRVRDSGVEIDEAPVRGDFPLADQREFGLHMAEVFGFDFEAGRLDMAAHPFCLGVNPGDVRLTWRTQDDDLRPALFGILHEVGHGLYEQGLPAASFRTPAGGAVSLGIHESQSRLWENLVGRSRPFWDWALPRLQEALPGTGGTTVDALWPALHTAVPSLIRVEADEATYNLHIVARFELERALVAGDLPIADLPGAWNEAYRRLLGLDPPDAASGVLQDIHWSLGAFGYFPTYTLGTLASCQLFAAASEELGDLEGDFRRGEFGSLLGWLRDKMHLHGSRFSAAELLERATGRPLEAEPFLAYLEGTLVEAYGL